MTCERCSENEFVTSAIGLEVSTFRTTIETKTNKNPSICRIVSNQRVIVPSARTTDNVASTGADGPGQDVSGLARSHSGKNLAGPDLGPQGGPVESGPVALVARLFGANRAPPPPPPSMEDVGSTFFTVKGRSKEAHAAAAAAKRPHGVDGGGGGGNTRTAGPWRPGLPVVSPGLGAAGDEGGDGGIDDRGG